MDVSARRLVIFDFDGTLADTLEGITSTARLVLRNHGLTDEDLGDLRRIVGPPFPQAFTLVYGIGEDEAVEITREYRAAYACLGPAGWPLFDGVEELLRDLRADGRLVAVASSKRTGLVAKAVADAGVADLFDLCLGKENDETDTKEATIRRVLSGLGVPAGEAVMVGDRRFDVEAAAACGIPCVGAHYGDTCPRSELADAGAVAVVETVGELRRALLG